MPAIDSVRSPAPVQTKLKIGRPGDKYEREADALANKVIGKSDYDRPMQMKNQIKTPAIHRMCTDCENEKLQMSSMEEEEKIQMKTLDPEPTGHSGFASEEINLSLNAAKGSGKPLSENVSSEFGGKIGYDFNPVKIHTGSKAIQMNTELGAQAFTHGNDIYFNRGKYNPESNKGKHLLAHELTHVVQQNTSNARGNMISQKHNAPRVQLKLLVDDKVPVNPNEPARKLSKKAFRSRVFPQADTLIQSLCPEFKVNFKGEVIPKKNKYCKNKSEITKKSKNPLGCCCLCIMTAPGSSTWRLVISEFEGPRTRFSDRKIFVHPRGSLFSFGNWAVPSPGKSKEHVEPIDPVIVLGHEICGHAALLELNAHAARVDRVRSNVHDSTVRVQNVIGREQGVTVNNVRALASQGTHRGESTVNITISNFPFNVASVSSLPANQKKALQRVANFALKNKLWIDIVGHSDTIGTAKAKLSISQKRANAVKGFFIGKGLTSKFNRRGLKKVKRYTRVEGVSDFNLLPGSVSGKRDAKLRRVDIIMTSRPSGAQNPVTGTPTTMVTVNPKDTANVSRLKSSGNPCEKLLVEKAWP